MSNKNYNFDKAKALIEEKKESLESAALGMHEDWFWTANKIWENGVYTQELISNEDADKMNADYIAKRREGVSLFSDELKELDKHLISGIYGSHWATPTLQLNYLNGTDEMVECSIGEQDISLADKIEKQIECTSGCLSEGVQMALTPLKTN